MKVCTKCHNELDFECFNRRKASKDGLQPYCRDCQAAANTSPKGREVRRRSNEKYKATPKGQEALARAVARRKERLRAAKGRVTMKQWNELVRKCGLRCVRCGASEQLFRDHIAPISKGGDNTLANMQPLCRSCNLEKGNRYVRDFRTADVIAWAKEQTVLLEKQYQSTVPPDQKGS